MSEQKDAKYGRQQQRLNWLGLTIAKYAGSKDREYGSSWRIRGGTGAFHQIARKWDRIEQACREREPQYDLFDRFAKDQRIEGIQDDVVDLAGYMLVLLEHMVELGYVKVVCGQDVTLIAASNTIHPSSGMEAPFGYDAEDEME